MTRGDPNILQGDDIAPLNHLANRRIIMKKSVWKYGLLSGLALAIPMGFAVPLEHQIGARWSMVFGYTIMVLSFLIIFVGVKHYRDTECGGSISFGRALAAGTLMMLISCACYVAMWEGLVATVEKHFAHDYAASMVKHAKNSGLQGPALDAKIAAAHDFEVMYSNPVYRMAMTLLEPLPVDLVMALVTAGILRRKPGDAVRSAASPEALAN
jgi:hypothetical protein